MAFKVETSRRKFEASGTCGECWGGYTKDDLGPTPPAPGLSSRPDSVFAEDWGMGSLSDFRTEAPGAENGDAGTSTTQTQGDMAATTEGNLNFSTFSNGFARDTPGMETTGAARNVDEGISTAPTLVDTTSVGDSNLNLFDFPTAPSEIPPGNRDETSSIGEFYEALVQGAVDIILRLPDGPFGEETAAMEEHANGFDFMRGASEEM
jgi:hypothetical protein